MNKLRNKIVRLICETSPLPPKALKRSNQNQVKSLRSDLLDVVLFHFAPQGGAVNVHGARRLALIPATAPERFDNAVLLIPCPPLAIGSAAARMMVDRVLEQP